jgi:hypothetical protein
VQLGLALRLKHLYVVTLYIKYTWSLTLLFCVSGHALRRAGELDLCVTVI